MKKFILFIFLFTVSLPSWGQRFSMGANAGIFSKTLIGTDKVTGMDGKLVSNGNLQYGVDLSFSMTNSMQLLLAYTSRSVDFDNSNNIIAGDEKFDMSNTSLGFRWIALRSVAFRLLYTMDKDLGFNLNGSNQAVLYAENIGYVSLFWDQIVFLYNSFYAGFKLGYDVNASAETNEGRQGGRAQLFTVIDGLEISYEIKDITKNNASFDFTQKDNILSLGYRLRF